MEKAEKFQKERHFHGQLGKEFRENMIIEPIEGWQDPEMPNVVDQITSS